MLRKKYQANLHPDTHTHIWDPRKNDKTAEEWKQRVMFIVINSLINQCANYYTAPNASIN